MCVNIYTDTKNCGRCGNKLVGLNKVCDTGKSYTWPQDSKPCPKTREWQREKGGCRLASCDACVCRRAALCELTPCP